MSRTVTNPIPDVNRRLPSGVLFVSPNWQQRILPLHVTHDRTVAEAMARDGFPVAAIDATPEAGRALQALLETEPEREDHEVWWMLDLDGDDRDAVVAAYDAFATANFDATTPYYRMKCGPYWSCETYERQVAPTAPGYVRSWAAEIELDRREEQERIECERRAREAERAARVAPEEVFASPDWRERSAPLLVTHDRARAVELAEFGAPVICVPATYAGVRALADLVLAEPHRPRYEDRIIRWLVPVVTQYDLFVPQPGESAADESRRRDREDRLYEEQAAARRASNEMYGEFKYWTDPALREYAILRDDDEPGTFALPNVEPTFGEKDPSPPPKVRIDFTPICDWLCAGAEAADLSPHKLARGFLATVDPDKLYLLRKWLGEYWRWEGGAYRRIPHPELRADLVRWLEGQVIKVHKEHPPEAKKDRGPAPVTQALVDNVLQAMDSLCILSARIAAPAWTLNVGGPEPSVLLPMPNGLLNLEAVAHGWRDRLLPPSTFFFTTTAAPFEYRPDTPVPREWLRFLNQIFDGDRESIAALQEWFGLLMVPDTSHQKMLLMVGPRRSGKGTIGRVLRELVGQDNVTSPTLSELAGPFGLEPLLGKLVTVIPDARLGPRTETATVTERLLAISGEDAVTVNRKNQSQVEARLRTRFVICTNELPKMPDAAAALPSRMIVLQTKRSFFGKEDLGLEPRLLAQLPGIFTWAVEGWCRLHRRGYLTQPAAGQNLVDAMTELSSPVQQFVRERCVIGTGHDVPCGHLFDAWRRWCTEHGRREHGTVESFGRDLRAAASEVGKSRRRDAEGRTWCYTGIRLWTPGDPDPE